MQNGDESFAEHHYSRSVASDLTMQVLSVSHIKDVKQAKVITCNLVFTHSEDSEQSAHPHRFAG